MDRIVRLMKNINYLPETQLKVYYREGTVTLEFLNGRSQAVKITRQDDHYHLTTVVLGGRRLTELEKDPEHLADLVWRRNRRTDVVNFTFDKAHRLIGRIDLLAPTLDKEELFFYLHRLAVECDRMEYLLTGQNLF